MKQVKKSLTLLLALIMALGLMSVNAGAAKKIVIAAEPTEAEMTKVADIEADADDEIATLMDGDAEVEFTPTSGGDAQQSAMPTNITAAGTYKLLKDVSLTSKVIVNVSNGTVTLDLNGHTITSTGLSRCALDVYGNKLTFEITNTAEAQGEWDITSSQFGIEFNDHENTYNIGKNVLIDIHQASWGVFVWCDATEEGKGNTLNVEGKIHSENGAAIQTHGTATKFTTINIKNGADILAENDIAMYIPGEGSALNISGGKISGETGVYVKTGKLNITGGEITGTGEALDYVYNGSGANSTGAALVIDNCGYPGGDPEATISGGTFNSAHTASVMSCATGSYTALTGFITGGTFLTEGSPDTETVQAYLSSEKNGAVLNDEGELVNSQEAANTDNGGNKFTLSLQRVDGSYKDNDNDGAIEVQPSNEVTYNIMLKSDDKANLSVNAIAFKVNATDGLQVKKVDVNGKTLTTNDFQFYRYYADGDTELLKTDNADTDVNIGSIVFTVQSAAEKDDKDDHSNWITPTLTDATLTEKGNANTVVLAPTTDKSVETPIYKLTLIPMKANATTGVVEADADASTTLDYKFASGATLSDAVAIPGYKFQNWKVTAKSDKGTWEQDKTYKTTIPAGLTGTATLTAQYTEISYTVAFDLDHGAATWETAKASYTIKDIANTNDDFLQLAKEPTRLGYKFNGWKASKTGSSAVAYNWTEEVFTGAKQNCYGNVKFTAQWENDGSWKAIDYAYARTGDSLVLFKASSNSAVKNVLYCNGHAMFKLPAAGLEKYKGEFNLTANDDTLYAYITSVSKTGAASRPNFEDKAAVSEGDNNEEILYNGNVVYSDTAINAGDFGNVNSVLSDNDAFTYNTFSIRSRLEADMGLKTGEGAEALARYGSIDDVKAIADLVGKDLNATNP